MIKKGVVINSGTITAGVNLTGGVLTITDVGSIPAGGLQVAPAALVAAVGETLGGFTVTPTAAACAIASSQFFMQIQQYDTAAKVWQTVNINYVNPASGGTLTTAAVCTAIGVQITNLISAGILHCGAPTVTGTTVAVAALTGYALLIGTNITNMPLSSVTAGVQATGTADYILAQYPDATVTAGSAYSYAHIVYNEPASSNAGNQNQGAVALDLWVKTSLTGYSTFASDYAAAVAALLLTQT